MADFYDDDYCDDLDDCYGVDGYDDDEEEHDDDSGNGES